MSKSQHKYRVIIPYREPTYEISKRRSRSKTYLAQYDVDSETIKEAIELALKLFEEDASKSNVRWLRIPIFIDIKVEPL